MRFSQDNGVNSLEICAGAGGQAYGLERAGVEHVALVENDAFACATLKLNRPEWNVVEQDLRQFDGRPYRGIDLLTGGLPCPPFSIAGKQLGCADERNLFPTLFELIDQTRPKGVLIENVKGLMEPAFSDYRNWIDGQFEKHGFAKPFWRVLNACNYGVSQLRPRLLIVALLARYAKKFTWPEAQRTAPKTVGEKLLSAMQENGWAGAVEWASHANKIAPTIVGGSKKHGGPDLGPTRAKKAWAELHVDGHGIADTPPAPDFEGFPKLTVRMVAKLQGFPEKWQLAGRKTAAYRQVGNAFPPPLAKAIGESVVNALKSK